MIAYNTLADIDEKPTWWSRRLSLYIFGVAKRASGIYLIVRHQNIPSE